MIDLLMVSRFLYLYYLRYIYSQREYIDTFLRKASYRRCPAEGIREESLPSAAQRKDRRPRLSFGALGFAWTLCGGKHIILMGARRACGR